MGSTLQKVSHGCAVPATCLLFRWVKVPLHLHVHLSPPERLAEKWLSGHFCFHYSIPLTMNSHLALTQKPRQAVLADRHRTPQPAGCTQHWLQFTLLHVPVSNSPPAQHVDLPGELCRATSQEIAHQSSPWTRLLQQPNTRKLQENIKPNFLHCSFAMYARGSCCLRCAVLGQLAVLPSNTTAS